MREVHHAVYVDPHGRPVDPALVPKQATPSRASAGSSAGHAGTAPAIPAGAPAPGTDADRATLCPAGSRTYTRARPGAGTGTGHESAAPDAHDDGVHAPAASRAAAVQRIEVPLNLHAHGYWTEQRVPAMGSEARIVLGDAPEGLAAWASAELERLEQCWSRFRPDSELCRLQTGSGSWTPVSSALLLALTCAADLHRATCGRFDPTILDALERAGYDRSFELVEPSTGTPCVVPATSAAPGFARIDVDVDGSRVRVPRDVRIDLGGLGKGLAADLVARGLVDRGARSALVSLGGDLRAGRTTRRRVGHPGRTSARRCTVRVPVPAR